MRCFLNTSAVIVNHSGCVEAYACSCDASVICCAGDPCDACAAESSDDARLFQFSWPLVAGWYAMLVVLFCFGRRGGSSSCWRRRQDHRGRGEPGPLDEEEALTDVEFREVVVKTRRVGPDDDLAETLCTICLSPILVDDVVANLDCNHLYHHECILPWLRRKATCPLCAQRVDLEDTSSTELVSNPPSSSSRVLGEEQALGGAAREQQEEEANRGNEEEEAHRGSEEPLVVTTTAIIDGGRGGLDAPQQQQQQQQRAVGATNDDTNDDQHPLAERLILRPS